MSEEFNFAAMASVSRATGVESAPPQILHVKACILLRPTGKGPVAEQSCIMTENKLYEYRMEQGHLIGRSLFFKLLWLDCSFFISSIMLCFSFFLFFLPGALHCTTPARCVLGTFLVYLIKKIKFHDS